MRWWSPVVHAVVALFILLATVVATGCPTVPQAMPSLPSVLPAVDSWVAVPSGQFAWSSGSRANLGIYDALYSAGPMLFLIGLLALTILLVRVHRLPIWAPVAFVLGFAAIIPNLTLMPLGGALLLGALLLLQRTARDLQQITNR